MHSVIWRNATYAIEGEFYTKLQKNYKRTENRVNWKQGKCEILVLGILHKFAHNFGFFSLVIFPSAFISPAKEFAICLNLSDLRPSNKL